MKVFRFFSQTVLILLLIAISFENHWSYPEFTQTDFTTRAPFILELPELNNLRITQLAKAFPNTNLRTLKFRVIEPFSQNIAEDRIFTRINGESSTTLHRITRDREGYAITCDLDAKQGVFKLKRGKNVIEIFADDKKKVNPYRPGNPANPPINNYYASYVLFLGAGGENLNTGETFSPINANLEKIPVTLGDDRNAPEIIINLADTSLRKGKSVNLKGSVADEANQVEYLKINGQNVPLTEGKGKRDIILADDSPAEAKFVYDFTRSVSIGALPNIMVEAKDKAGNLTRLTLPVRENETRITAGFKGRKFAMIVGVSDYKFTGDGLKSLRYADDDALVFRDFLKSPQGGGFKDDEIRLLLNEKATLQGVDEAFNFLTRATAEDLVVIFLAGHGSPDPFDPKNLYYLLHDTKIADIPKTSLAMTALQQFLENQLRSKRTVVFVDTCHSAGLSGKKLSTTRNVSENNLINLYASKLFNEEGRAVLTSADLDETSFESEKWGGGHGVFSWALLEGLQGKADSNSDGFITAGEVFGYVSDRVAQETNFRQNPRPLLGSNRDLTLSVTKK
jgi:uncharacterized caspase-like protein